MSRPASRIAAGAARSAVAAASLAACASTGSPPAQDAAAASGDPVTGGTLTYLEHQTYTNLYPPQAGFYPNGGLVNNIAARLTWQNPETLEIEPWVATDWTVNDDATEYTFNAARRRHLLGRHAARRGRRRQELRRLRPRQPRPRAHDLGGDQQLRLQRGRRRRHRDVPLRRLRRRASCRRPRRSTPGCSRPATLDRSLEEFGAGNATDIVGSGPFVITDEKLGTELTLEAREDYDWAPP